MEETMAGHDTAIEVKPWGSTQLLLFDGVCQVNRIHVVDCGYSSRHLHRTKVNVFTVLRGRLEVVTYHERRSGSLRAMSEVILSPGQSTSVDAGTIHRFMAFGPTEALEAYYAHGATEVSLDDIVRFDSNGVFV